MVTASQSGQVLPYGEIHLTGVIKSSAADFQVTEKLGFKPSGEGEHLFLYVEKNNLTTHQLIEQVARVTGLNCKNIGYAGLKDKHAITRQWISLHLPGAKCKPEIPDTENYQVLESAWHDKKLRVGIHRSNSFDVVVREITGQSDDFETRIEKLSKHGFANYFGQQRFGQKQDNVEQALRVLNNRHKAKRLNRNKKSLYLSALRSELFNRILASRIGQGIWQQPVEGDVFMLAGSQSVFSESLNHEILKRYSDKDIHSAISLFGTGESRLSARALDIEQQVIKQNPEIADTLIRNKIKRSFRANRALVSALQADFNAERTELRIRVELEKGFYLTTLLNHLLVLQNAKA